MQTSYHLQCALSGSVTVPPIFKMSSAVVSKVRYMYQPGGPVTGPCGYCHGDDSRFCVDGVWAEKISAQDFQELIDRGCQRSGQYIYQPNNSLTCCPQYILRLDVSTFRVSKSQRRVLRRVNEYLKTGQQHTGGEGEGSASTSQATELEKAPTVKIAKVEPSQIKKKHVTPGKGADPSKPPSRKAKELRRERKQLKLAALGEKMETSVKQVSKKSPAPHNLIELVRLPDSQECQHKLEVKLICTNPVSQEFWDTYEESYKVFRKFQMVIHKEPEHKCSETQFKQFIVDSPLFPEESPIGLKYGSYHQQYWLDDNLIMIGVLDIIPRGVLCNYLYYDPDVRFLAPGVYSALREIAFNQELYQCNPSFQYYYMGYYVHDCPKMNYKSQYDSAYILCSESLVYLPLERARVRLDEMMTKRKDDETLSKHCRLVDEMQQQETYSEEDRDKVLVSYGQKAMEYGSFRRMHGERYDRLVNAYLTMVGRVCAPRIQLQIIMTFGL